MERWSSPTNRGIEFCWADAWGRGLVALGERECLYTSSSSNDKGSFWILGWRREWKRASSCCLIMGLLSYRLVKFRCGLLFDGRWHIQHHPAQLYLSNFTLCTRDGRKFWILISQHQGGLSCNSTSWIRCYTSPLPNSNGGWPLQTSCPKISKNPGATFSVQENGCTVVAVESEKDWQRFGGRWFPNQSFLRFLYPFFLMS